MQFAIGNGIEALKGLLKEICNYKAEAASRINCTANEMATRGSEREEERECSKQQARDGNVEICAQASRFQAIYVICWLGSSTCIPYREESLMLLRKYRRCELFRQITCISSVRIRINIIHFISKTINLDLYNIYANININ